MRRKGIFTGMLLLLPVLLLAGCSSEKEGDRYYLLLKGESEHWTVNDYQIEITPDLFKAGYGEVIMKNRNHTETDFYEIDVHAVIGDQDRVVQHKSVTGNTTIDKVQLGLVGGGPYLDHQGEPIKLEHVSQVYMMIEWQEEDQVIQEKVDLYS